MRVSGVIRRVAALALASGVAVATMAMTAGTANAATTYKGKVTANGGLTIRSAPSTHTSNNGNVAKGTTITIACKVPGTRVDGNGLWYKLSNGKGWVTARYVTNIGSAPKYCPSADTEYGDGRTTAAVNMRRGPHFNDVKTGVVYEGTRVAVVCYVKSTAGVNGNYLWYQLTNKSWVTAAFVKRLNTPASNWVPCA
ncbi:SH3 domain-containing protein [Microlunatus parietis]|uniref:Uncharacterized protein YraI n=1 Tax=Microlunatus parietis TaxID=682979 RepID=A0A7Y9L8I9_9ACTN|nr:SH3 domain-containing protein [Microlunatus parietis]NYE70814.1 uncharacterized protein YraI [Microlunatus parietis]